MASGRCCSELLMLALLVNACWTIVRAHIPNHCAPPRHKETSINEHKDYNTTELSSVNHKTFL